MISSDKINAYKEIFTKLFKENEDLLSLIDMLEFPYNYNEDDFEQAINDIKEYKEIYRNHNKDKFDKLSNLQKQLYKIMEHEFGIPMDPNEI